MITLDLIAMNTYNSVKAPPGRGFSYIEIWLVGIQIPILLAIAEYGILLTMKRGHQKQTEQTDTEPQKEKWDLDRIGKTMDKWTFVASISFTIVFNLVYWSVALTGLDM